MPRRVLALATVLALLLVPTSAGAAQSNAGTASSSLALGSLTIEGLPAGLDSVVFPSMRSFASTDPDAARNVLGGGKPFALSGVTLPLAGEVAARSDGHTTRSGSTVPLVQGLGSLTAGKLSATAADGTATSTIDALSGELALLAGGLTVELPRTGAFSIVNGKEAESVNGAVLRDLHLGLTDILPLSILNQLPLDVLLDLVDSLPITIALPVDLHEIRVILEGLIEDLALAGTLQETLVDLQGQIDDAQAQLDEATAALPLLDAELAVAQTAFTAAQGAVESATGALATAKTALDAAQGAVTTAQSDIAALEAQIAELGGCDNPLAAVACGLLATAQAALVPLQSALALAQTTYDEAVLALAAATAALAEARSLRDAAQAAVDAAQHLIDTLPGVIAGLEALLLETIGAIIDLLESIEETLATIPLGQLKALLDELVKGLAATDLLRIEELTVGVASIATAGGSSAEARCEVAGVSLLGSASTATTCADLQGVLASLKTSLDELVGELPLQSTLSQTAIAVDGLATTASAPGARDGAYHTASASVTALRVAVPSVQLTQVVDGLLADVTGLLDSLLEGALADLPDLLEDTDLTSTVDVASLTEQLEALTATLTTQLPTGAALAGVGTPALGLSVLDMGTSSQFVAAGAGTPPGGTPQVTTPPATPQPAAPGTLPKTGGSSALLALALLGLGGGSAYALRGRRVRD